ncbi:MAG: hypothetical protein EAY75_09625 [Bacteroidetes bacterium]|nr:MAG: hypothetical protein EAY75_09625 [Bacteroidota bacterium]
MPFKEFNSENRPKPRFVVLFSHPRNSYFALNTSAATQYPKKPLQTPSAIKLTTNLGHQAALIRKSGINKNHHSSSMACLPMRMHGN